MRAPIALSATLMMLACSRAPSPAPGAGERSAPAAPTDPAGGSTVAATAGASLVAVEIAPAGPGETAGDVVAVFADGGRRPLTSGRRCLDAKLGPGGLVGWTEADEQYKGMWVNDHLQVQRGEARLIEVSSDRPFIEAWGFAPEGVVVKSRATHGPATIELFSLADGRRLEAIDAWRADPPSWAAPFAEGE